MALAPKPLGKKGPQCFLSQKWQIVKRNEEIHTYKFDHLLIVLAHCLLFTP